MTSLTLTAQNLTLIDHALDLAIEEYKGKLAKYWAERDRTKPVSAPVTLTGWGELEALRASFHALVLTVEVNA